MKKKHELLKFAYDNYPKGAKFIGATRHNPIAHESTGDLRFSTDYFGIINYPNGKGIIYDGTIDKWAEIVKPKIAVKVENDKEFKAIEKHLGKKSFFTSPFQTFSYPVFIYLDGGKYPDEDFVSIDCGEIYLKDYQIIPFAEFAKEHGVKLPMITSEDGVELYEGDSYYRVELYNGEWNLSCYTDEVYLSNLQSSHFVVHSPESGKAFSTKQAALSWIEAQKPKNVIISPDSSYPIIVYRNPVCGNEYIHLDMSKRGDYNGANIHLTIHELRQALKAYDEMHS